MAPRKQGAYTVRGIAEDLHFQRIHLAFLVHQHLQEPACAGMSARGQLVLYTKVSSED